MEKHRIETKVEQDRSLTLKDLPFHAGASVEVTIVLKSETSESNGHCSLRGTPVTYIRPFESVAEAEWDSAR